MINHNRDTLTLHIRLTKHCNADCSYCSSFQINPDKKLDLVKYSKCIEQVYKIIEKYNFGGSRNSISVQYIGGELLTLPTQYINEIKNITKSKLSPIFKNYIDGGQTNLIGSINKVRNLNEIFEGNIGTSYDYYTNQRTIKGDSKKYKQIFLKNLSDNKRTTGKVMGGVVVLDEKMLPHIINQVEDLCKKNTNITLRPVFKGGMNISRVSTENIETAFLEVFEYWFLQKKNIIEPFYSMVSKRVNKNNISLYSGCPFQANCGEVSINLEPNGDLYLCQDMADSGEFKLGNALEGEFNEELLLKIRERPHNLDHTCYSCNYLNECQGGCLKEAVEQGYGLFGKSDNCKVWKQIFQTIDYKISELGINLVQEWLKSIK